MFESVRWKDHKSISVGGKGCSTCMSGEEVLSVGLQDLSLNLKWK